MGAYKAVSAGIQAVAARLKSVPEGHPNAKPRCYLVRDALVERDAERDAARLPCSTEKVLAYVWDTGSGRKVGEEQMKANDHGMDTWRYLVAYVDAISRSVPQVRFRPA